MRLTGDEADDGLPWEDSDSSPDLLARVHGDVPRTPSVQLARAVQPTRRSDERLEWDTTSWRLRNGAFSAIVIVCCCLAGVFLTVLAWILKF